MKSLKSNLQEKIILLKLRTGDSDAFAYFYNQYVARIYRFVFMKVSDKDLAQDMTQEIFLKVWQQMVDKKQIKSFTAFIFRIARNTVIDHYRQKDNQSLPLEYIEDISQDQASSPDKHLDKHLDLKRLLQNLQNLKDEYKEVLLLRYVEDLSIDDIAQVIQKDKNNVRVLIHRALNKLKELSHENQ